MMEIYVLTEKVTGYSPGTKVTIVADKDSSHPTCMTLKLDKSKKRYIKCDFIYPQWNMMKKEELEK